MSREDQHEHVGTSNRISTMNLLLFYSMFLYLKEYYEIVDEARPLLGYFSHAC